MHSWICFIIREKVEKWDDSKPLTAVHKTPVSSEPIQKSTSPHAYLEQISEHFSGV